MTNLACRASASTGSQAREHDKGGHEDPKVLPALNRPFGRPTGSHCTPLGPLPSKPPENSRGWGNPGGGGFSLMDRHTVGASSRLDNMLASLETLCFAGPLHHSSHSLSPGSERPRPLACIG